MRATLSRRTPYSRPVANDYPYSRSPIDRDLLRDVAAVVLMVAGIAGLAFVAFAIDPLAGVATLSAASIAAGAFLGYRR